MKITIPSNLIGKELTAFLMANKSAILSQKKSMPIKHTEPFVSDIVVNEFKKKTIGKKDMSDNDNTEDPTNSDIIHCKVVANTFLWMDSDLDVLLPGCCKRTISERKGKFVQLHDHIYKIDAKIGEVTDVYTQLFNLTDLGLSKSGNTECLIFEFDCYKSYNEQIFNQYKAQKINQHSIGLQYVSIDIAINDPDSPKEMDFWNKYINLIINKDTAIERGFFFVVSEIKLLENSCVLFGANEITPTLESGKSQSVLDIQETDPSLDTADEFDLKEALKSIKFLN